MSDTANARLICLAPEMDRTLRAVLAMCLDECHSQEENWMGSKPCRNS